MGRAKVGRRRLWITVAVVAVVLAAAAYPSYKALKGWRSCQNIHDGQMRPGSTVYGAGTKALLVGDSWSARWQIGGGVPDWAALLAKRERWELHVDALATSGYVHPSACGAGQFGRRVTATETRYPVVVLEGGINDATSGDAGRVEVAARQLIGRFGQGKVFVLGAPSVPARARSDLATVNAGLRAAAERAGATFVDTSGWALSLQSDRLHLDAAGHRRFAADVARSIRG